MSYLIMTACETWDEAAGVSGALMARGFGTDCLGCIISASVYEDLHQMPLPSQSVDPVIAELLVNATIAHFEHQMTLYCCGVVGEAGDPMALASITGLSTGRIYNMVTSLPADGLILVVKTPYHLLQMTKETVEHETIGIGPAKDAQTNIYIAPFRS